MAISTLAITSIDLVSTTPPANIFPPSPWLVQGTVTLDVGTTLDAMAYQIDEGPVTSFPCPPGIGGPFEFPLSDANLPASGGYLLTVYAWDDGTDSRTQTLQIQLSNMPPMNPPAPPECQP